MRRVQRRALVAASAVLVSVWMATAPVAAVPTIFSDIVETVDRTDFPVQNGIVNRTWVWGDQVTPGPILETYDGACTWFRNPTTPYGPGQEYDDERAVAYFDKGRLEHDDCRKASPPWNVTSGLLVDELMSGKLQLGDARFEQHQPGTMPVAGDPDAIVTPTYATFAPLRDYRPVPAGWALIQTVAADGSVAADARRAAYGATAVDVGAPTNHTVASVFWDFLNSRGLVFVGVSAENGNVTFDYERQPLFPNPFYVTGYPITEAYWAQTKVDGVARDVLLQCFERRCLTYTPDNPAGWQVEFGNVGLHYYHWRYVEIPAE